MVMHNISDEIILDIYKSFEYFRSSVSDIEIHEVILSGGAALIQGFADLMAERLHLPVTIADPFSNIKLSSRLDADFIKDIAPLAAVVVGLALRRPGDRR
jgi:type IV pilus assembly protein PilM